MSKTQAIGLGTQLRHLLELLDGEVDALYAQGKDRVYRPRFTPIMRALEQGDVLSVRSIADRTGVTHSAASQTVSKMAALGLVDVTSGDDARSRDVRLSRTGRSMLPRLRKQWDATRRAAEQLDAEVGGQLSSTLDAAINALQARPFGTRVRAHLEASTRKTSR